MPTVTGPYSIIFFLVKNNQHGWKIWPHSRIQIWDLMAQRNPALFYEKEEDLLLELQEWVIALRLLDLQIAIKIIFIFF